METLIVKEQGRQATAKALRKGLLTRPESCSRCGAAGVIHAHHEDYTDPLNVVWLCRTCHGRRHVEINKGRPKRSRKEPPNKARGHLIRSARERRALTQWQLAARVGVHHNTVWRWERGGRVPLRRRRKLGAVLGLNLEVLA